MSPDLTARTGEGPNGAASASMPASTSTVPMSMGRDPDLARFGGARVLITGGVGLIGSALARRLAGLGAELVVLDSMVPEGGANPANIADLTDRGLTDRGRVRVNIADIRDTAALHHLLPGQDFLFDLAGQTSHLESMNAPEHDLAVNCMAQLQLLELCREIAPEITIVHAGTRQVYG